MKIWQFIYNSIEQNESCILLLVTESKGSSPGRKGFKMALNARNESIGSIGGGIMEYNWVNDAQKRLQESDPLNYYRSVVHEKDSDCASGLICSGSQTIFSIFISPGHKGKIEAIIRNNGPFWVDKLGDIFSDLSISKKNYFYKEGNMDAFEVYIFGAGHVGEALAKLCDFMNYPYTLFDNRPVIVEKLTTLNTRYISYRDLFELQQPIKGKFCVVMTYSLKSDIEVLRNIINMGYSYLGVMGSKAKNRAIREELLQNNIKQEHLDLIRIPIGVKINSKTPNEIAISVLAEIIQYKNTKD